MRGQLGLVEIEAKTVEGYFNVGDGNDVSKAVDKRKSEENWSCMGGIRT